MAQQQAQQAQTAGAEEPLVIVKKNATEEVRVTWSHFNGGRFLDVRVYSTDGPEPKPTKKGLCLTPQVWRQILPRVAEEVAGALPRGGAEGQE